MRSILLIILTFSLLSSTLYADELQLIKQNFNNLLLLSDEEELVLQLTSLPKETVISDQMVVELMDRYPLSSDYIDDLILQLQADGSWPDIDYTDNSRSGWIPKLHVSRVLELTKAYSNSDSPFYHSKKIADAIHNTLEFWFREKLICPNWWHNQIGVPKTLGAVFLLFENELSAIEKQNAIEIMNNAKFGMTGQNKVWLAGNVLIKALLQNDFNLVKEARDIILSEIGMGYKEGIKDDYSFHQHGAQQQFGNYGLAYITSMASWGKVFNGTSLAIEQEKLDILSNLINKGYRQILWKGHLDVNALGRQFFKQVQKHKAFSVAVSSKAFVDIDSINRKQYEELLADNYELPSFPNKTLLNGPYHFWQSDQTIHRRPYWMASVKMSSPRVIGAESINGDNKKGFYLADGATYIYVDGDEYNNIFAVWDWRKIPGTTTYSTNLPLKTLGMSGYHNNNPFVGNVNNKQVSFTAMHFKREGINARKAWIFTDDFVLCLGAGISADSGCVVTTAIEQSMKKADLMYLNRGKWQNIQNKNWQKQANQRFFHNKTGYIVLSKNTGNAVVENKTGDWHDVMQTYPKGSIDNKEVFSLWIDHGVDPDNDLYQYLLLPASTTEKVKEFDVKSIKVIKNSKNVQAVNMPSIQTFFMAAYSSSDADIKISGKFSFQNIDPGLFIINYQGKSLRITISDPTQTLQTLSFKINGEHKTVTLPDGNRRGTSITIEYP